MKTVATLLATVLVVAVQFLPGLALPSTVPSFLWSPHQDGLPTSEAVNYRTLTPKELAKSVMSEGGWSNLLCSDNGAQQSLDIGLVFVGKELHSHDLSRPRKADSSLVDLLKGSFVSSNFSLAFPYIAASEEGHSVENSLVSEFTDTCGHDLETSKVAFLESCSVGGGNFEKLPDILSVQNYLVSRMEKRSKGHSDLIVLCHSGSEGSEEQASEGQVLTDLISHMEHLGAKYTVLYVSDPLRSIQYPTHRALERFFAELQDSQFPIWVPSIPPLFPFPFSGFSHFFFVFLSAMVASSVASPLCTWLVAACMSAACEKDHRWKSPSIFQSPRWLRRKRTLAWSGNLGGGFVSSLYGSGIHGLMSSCFAFEPCQEYYNSRGLPFFGDNALSLFGFKLAPVNRRQRRMNKAAHSGKTMAVAVQPEKEALSKKKPITEKRRVVVTGIGVVSPVGHNVDEFYNNLLDGVSGISEIESFDCSDFPTRIAGEIKNFSADGWVSPKLSKRADKFMLYMLTAGKKALADGGITEDVIKELDKAKCGVLIGSALGGMKVFNDAIEALRVSYKKMNPFCVPFATTNMGSAMLAMDLGWMGPNYSISTACATSNFCILNAANHIIRGETDMMLCGGSDSAIIPIGLGGFVACRALSTRNSDPTRASRPWDMERDGFVMGEGSGVLLLEELEHAKKRGAKIYAEFLGGSFTCDAYHMTEPHPDGAGTVLCIEKALKQSGVKREDVNYINAHATSTPAGDLKEYQAIIRCFGQNSELKINSTKSMIGHLLGAAGAVEAIAAIMAIQTGWVHPNTNLEKPDEGLQDTGMLVGSKKERLDIKVALSNSFGFGGHNSSILFAPYKDD